MALDVLLALLLVQDVDVLVVLQVSGQRPRPMPNVEVTLSRSGQPQEPPQLTGSNGRTRFSSVRCSEEIKFSARMISGTFSNPSSDWACRPFVGIKIRRR